MNEVPILECWKCGRRWIGAIQGSIICEVIPCGLLTPRPPEDEKTPTTPEQP